MTENDPWFEREFGTCEHGQMRAYCIGCSDEDERIRKAQARREYLEDENARLRRLLYAHGASDV
jgi:hypothetical protein